MTFSNRNGSRTPSRSPTRTRSKSGHRALEVSQNLKHIKRQRSRSPVKPGTNPSSSESQCKTYVPGETKVLRTPAGRANTKSNQTTHWGPLTRSFVRPSASGNARSATPSVVVAASAASGRSVEKDQDEGSSKTYWIIGFVAAAAAAIILLACLFYFTNQRPQTEERSAEIRQHENQASKDAHTTRVQNNGVTTGTPGNSKTTDPDHDTDASASGPDLLGKVKAGSSNHKNNQEPGDRETPDGTSIPWVKYAKYFTIAVIGVVGVWGFLAYRRSVLLTLPEPLKLHILPFPETHYVVDARNRFRTKYNDMMWVKVKASGQNNTLASWFYPNVEKHKQAILEYQELFNKKGVKWIYGEINGGPVNTEFLNWTTDQIQLKPDGIFWLGE